MNKEQYQEVAEEVVNDLKEMYVFAERTEELEELLKLQRASMLNQAKKEAENMLFIDQENRHMKLALIKVMEMSDEEVMETFISKFLGHYLKSGKESLDDYLN